MWPREQLSLRNRNWRKNLKQFITEVVKRYNKVTIILFGSRARGDYSALSDTDLLVVLEKTSIRTLEDILSIAYKSDLIAPEIHLFEKEWVLENFEKNTVLLDAIYEGIVLIDNLRIIRQLKNRLTQLMKLGWRKQRDGWFKERTEHHEEQS